MSSLGWEDSRDDRRNSSASRRAVTTSGSFRTATSPRLGFSLAATRSRVLHERGDPLGLEAFLSVVQVEQDQLVKQRPEPADHRPRTGEDLGPQGDQVLDRDRSDRLLPEVSHLLELARFGVGGGLEQLADPLGLRREVHPSVVDLDGLDELPDPVVLPAPRFDPADPEVGDDLLDPFVLSARRGGEAEDPAPVGPVGAVPSGEGHVGVLPHGVVGLVEHDQRHVR